MNNLIKRTITGAVYAVLTVIVLLYGGNTIAVAYLFFLAFLSYVEYLQMNMKSAGFKKLLLSLFIAPIVFGLVYFNQDAVINTGWYTTILLGMVCAPVILIRGKDRLRRIRFTYLGYLIVIIPFALLGQIAGLPFTGTKGYELLPYTPVPVVMIFVFIWVSDTFAFIGGKLLGKTKLAPRISPGKTVEGLAIGLLMTNISALVLAPWCSPYLSVVDLIILANICVIFGVLGDLMISAFKRSLGIKDTGSALPGHGGFLDRFDSLLIAAPAAYIYLKSFLLFTS